MIKHLKRMKNPKEEENCGRRHANSNLPLSCCLPSAGGKKVYLSLLSFASLKINETLKKNLLLSLGLWPRSVFFEIWGRGRLT